MSNGKLYDIIIIGAGPAGMTAAIYALRAGKSVLVIEKGAVGGQMTYSPKIENFPGFASVSGNELADKMFSQMSDLGGDLEIDEVFGITNGEVKTVKTEFGEYLCRAVILANGVKHRMLGISGEDEYIGNGISFCAVCDGAFYKNKAVAVIGGGNSALQEAILLAENCSKVTVIQNLSTLTGEKKLTDIISKMNNVDIIYDTVIDSLITNEGLNGLKLKNSKNGTLSDLYCDGVFVAIGLVAENGAFDNLADLDDRGYYDSDEACMTKTAGVFVAGDCRKKRIRQVTTASADGSIAALAACNYIDSQK